jgi:hypothetical protein
MKRSPNIILLLLVLLIICGQSLAWLYPEHRDISAHAIQDLDPRYRAILDNLWLEARMGYEYRLSESVVDPTLGFIDYAAWPAIAGDHSCSSQKMLYNVLKTDWILEVSKIAAELKNDLSEATSRHNHINAVRDSDIKFQKADPFYATRAGSNNVHFLLARPETHTSSSKYGNMCIAEGSELNAIGAYAWFHASALEKATLLSNEALSQEQRSQLALSVLADEAFALHFLQDIFASGHVAGTWGDASQRKGTHDYYNENGLEVTTWDGKRFILMGDAWISPGDIDITAESIRKSIEQILDIITGTETVKNRQPDFWQADSFNVCKENYWPHRDVDPQLWPIMRDVLISTPVPGLATGHGSLPRFRTELGPFIGVVPAIKGIGIARGFGSTEVEPGGTGSIEMAIRIGVGLEGVLNESGDGLVFLDIGNRLDGNSTLSRFNSPDQIDAGGFSSAIPSRDAFFFRVRMPFWLLPLDMLVTAPFLLPFAPDTYSRMAIQSANGGLIPWQTGIATSIGRFQFILGREFGITFYGYNDNKDVMIVPYDDESAALIRYQSTQWDFPFVEYRPFRTFSTNQSSSMVVQFSFGFDYPHSQELIIPDEGEPPELNTIWYIGMRIAFDWRYYW